MAEPGKPADSFTPEQVAMMAHDLTPKFLGTRSESGHPNVVPILSIQAAGPKTFIFGEFLIWKTRQNLEADPSVAVLVISQDLRFFRFRGRLREFVRTGPHFDQVSSAPMFRYNPYTGVRGVWVGELVEAEPMNRISPLSVASGYLSNRLTTGSVVLTGNEERRALPPPVIAKVNKMRALKVVAGRGTECPVIFPDLSLWSPDPSALSGGSGVFRRHYREAAIGRDSELAVAVLTAEPVAFQIKGVVASTGQGRIGLRVTEAFTATPPVPGQRIDRPQ